MSADARSLAARLATARRAVLTIFFINGAVFASWAPYIPGVQQHHRLSEGMLGLALLCIALGGLVAMSASGWLLGRFGSRAVTATASLAFCLTLPLPVLAPSVPWLIVALLGFGIANGAMDVAMNAQGLAVERGYARPIFSSMHGLFSIGAMIGAVVGGWALATGLAPRTHLTAAAFGLGFLSLAAARGLLPPEADTKTTESHFARPTGPLLGLGGLAFICLLAEGAIADWSAVYLRFVLGTEAGVAAGGFAAFALLMAVGRLTGDRLTGQWGSVLLLRLSGLLATLGLILALWATAPALSIAGFGLVGLGLANVVPVLFRAGSRIPGVAPGMGIAAVATAGYCGFLGGPPLIGFAAEAITLTGALALVAALIGVIAARAPVARRAD